MVVSSCVLERGEISEAEPKLPIRRRRSREPPPNSESSTLLKHLNIWPSPFSIHWSCTYRNLSNSGFSIIVRWFCWAEHLVWMSRVTLTSVVWAVSCVMLQWEERHQIQTHHYHRMKVLLWSLESGGDTAWITLQSVSHHLCYRHLQTPEHLTHPLLSLHLLSYCVFHSDYIVQVYNLKCLDIAIYTALQVKTFI